MGDKIIVEDLVKSFSTRNGDVTAISNITVTIGEGEFFCLVGPSGCGKTTFLRILGGLEEKTAGKMIMNRSSSDKPGNAMIFQEMSIFPWMNVVDNVAFGLETRGVMKKERHRQAEPFIRKVGLTKFRKAYPHQLSGGMKQRVSIARALVTDPEVLLMDEPFANLDAQTRMIMQDELIRIWEEDRKTVVFITHSIDEAILLGDRVGVMTAHPGVLKEIFDVPFSRPRNTHQVRTSVEFGRLYDRIWAMLEEEVHRAAKEMV
ncbi:MAG: ABC transporter ATP-binding protein [Chloroflexi bacterium]|nr:ABC transporter ATP-binding protein [Chloroflexota bacterium]